MYKLCQWIYELAYKRGIEVGRQEILDEQERKLNQEMFDKITKGKL